MPHCVTVLHRFHLTIGCSCYSLRYYESIDLAQQMYAMTEGNHAYEGLVCTKKELDRVLRDSNCSCDFSKGYRALKNQFPNLSLLEYAKFKYLAWIRERKNIGRPVNAPSAPTFVHFEPVRALAAPS